MLLPRFEFHRPTGLVEACEVLKTYGDQAKLLAGGTDLLANMKKKLLAPKHLISLDRVAGLSSIETNKNQAEIGATTTVAVLAEDRALNKGFGLLAEAASRLGSPLVRNLATIGGNLANARPAADLAPPLLALGARVVLTSAGGQREVPIEEFFLGPGRSVLDQREVLSRIIIPRPEEGSGGAYVKLGLRKTLEIAIINVAAFVTLSSDGKKIKTARVALGAVAPTPIRAPQAEAALTGKTVGEKTVEQAALAAAADARPITDHRGSAEYRRLMVENLTRRALTLALENAR